MSTLTAQFDTSKIGEWGEEARFPVERERIVAYARATNDEIPQHADGTYAPPVFNVVPPFESLIPVVAGVVPVEHLMRVVHGEQDFRLHRPIEPDQALVVRCAATGIRARSSGSTVVVTAETRTEAGEPVCDQYMTSFFRGVIADEEAGEEPAGHAFPDEVRETEPLVVARQQFDSDQTFRYSEAAGDPMPIHLDEDFAKQLGFPGIIVHGLCTMAFCSRAVIEAACPEDPARLKRLAVRFSKPAFPGQEITTRIWRAGEQEGRDVLAFETAAETGDIVIKDGLAEITRAGI